MRKIITIAVLFLLPVIASATCQQDVITYVDADPDMEIVCYSQYNPFFGLMTQVIITEWNGSYYEVICNAAAINDPNSAWCDVSDCLGL